MAPSSVHNDGEKHWERGFSPFPRYVSTPRTEMVLISFERLIGSDTERGEWASSPAVKEYKHDSKIIIAKLLTYRLKRKKG